MRRATLLTLSFCLWTAFAPAAGAQEGKAPDPARETPAMGKELGRLRSEVAALKKQVAELKKAQDEARPQIDMLLKHRHSLFLDVMRADTLLPKAKGLFLVTTPSPEDFSKTSGPVSGPK